MRTTRSITALAAAVALGSIAPMIEGLTAP